jgi:SAM-dependent methyltransferase
MSSDVYTPEFFETTLAESYRSAQCIVSKIVALVPSIRSVLDVGCGPGHFLRAFAEAGVQNLRGIDGDYVPRAQLVIPVDRFTPVDLSSPFNLGQRFDLAISLEVAEHLPPASAGGFVDSLVAHAPLVLFSAAVPYQGGVNHVNEQWPRYWANLFAKKGLLPFDLLRPLIWSNEQVAWWYRQNCLLFANPDVIASCPGLAGAKPSEPGQLDMVHPALFLSRIGNWQALARESEDFRAFLTSGSAFSVQHLPDGRVTITRK